jgi:hypothetical protein
MLRLSVSREGCLPGMAPRQLSFIWMYDEYVCVCVLTDQSIGMCVGLEKYSERKCKFRDELWVDVEWPYFAWDLNGLRRCYWYSTGTIMVGGMQLNMWRPCYMVSVAVVFPSLIMSMRKQNKHWCFPIEIWYPGIRYGMMLLRAILFLGVHNDVKCFE